MNFNDQETLRHLVQTEGLQSVLDMIASVLEEDIGDQGSEMMQETFLISECLREFTGRCSNG